MDMTGERHIPAPRQLVWDALNDTETLKASIPGCESLEKVGDNQMKAVAAVKLGPISARFNGAVTLSDIDAPNSYTITGEGQGGVAGFAKGGAKVFLTDDAGATLLKYEVNAQVGGKLAQLGARLIDATAKQMAEQFFTKFSDEVGKLVPPELAVASPAMVPDEARPPPAAPPSAISPLALIPREPFGLPVMGWIGIVLFVGILVLTLASML
jgi:carbon monoxide dehydrogenase subunit G